MRYREPTREYVLSDAGSRYFSKIVSYWNKCWPDPLSFPYHERGGLISSAQLVRKRIYSFLTTSKQIGVLTKDDVSLIRMKLDSLYCEYISRATDYGP